VLLILRVLPRDSQFVPCVNQNPAALKNNSDKKVSDEEIEVEKNKGSEVPEFQGWFFFFFLDTTLMGLNSGGNHEHCLL